MSYKFQVKTADIPDAGTDSNIFVKLIGERGHTEFKRLNGHISGNAFEQGDTDKFSVNYGKDVGDIFKIIVRSDETWGAPGWLPEFFKITYDAPGRNTSEFDTFDWITDTKKHPFMVDSGYTKKIEAGWSYENIIMKDPVITYPNPTGKDISLNKEIKHSSQVMLNFQETTAVSAGVEESVDVGIEIIDASIKAELKSQIEETLGVEFTHTIAVTTNLEMTIESETELDVTPKWVYKYGNMNLIMGDTIFKNVRTLVDISYGGYDAVSKKLEMA